MFLCLGFWKTNNHETYISISEIRILKEGKIELSLELVAHDFEYAYQKKIQKKSSLFTMKNLNITITIYLRNLFLIIILFLKRTIKLILKIIGNEINLDGILKFKY